MSPNDTARELALALRDCLSETSCDELEANPEEVYEDLVARFVLKLSARKLAVVPVNSFKSGQAAMRIFDIFTKWLENHPERHYITGVDRSGKYEIILRTSGQTNAYCRGEVIQDAYGQAAQAIEFNGGTFDGNEEEKQIQG